MAEVKPKTGDLELLKSSYDMYDKTLKETEKSMRAALNEDGTKRYNEEKIQEHLTLIRNAQEDIVTQYLNLGGKEEDLKKKAKKKTTATKSVDYDALQAMEAAQKAVKEAERVEQVNAAIREANTQPVQTKSMDYDTTALFDVIPLPSKGEGYKEKIGKASVAYLTAYDENIIVSPNLYRSKKILDVILDRKLLSKEIQPMDLLEGDRDAIILFLRTSGYGNEYPITATDNITGKEFETTIDLSKLKFKEFNLKGDSNGWFSFNLPLSKKEVKFRFPTHKDVVLLEKMEEAEDAKIKKSTISDYADSLENFIENDESSAEEKAKVRKAIRDIRTWGEGISDEDDVLYNHNLTNKLNLLIMAVDGITDKSYISDFIRKMNVRDSAALRKYMTENEPGVDYKIEVTRPESLGGGSFTTFLQLDQFLFLNIAE